MAVNLFGLPEPDDLLGLAQKEAMESARRFAEMTHGIDLLCTVTGRPAGPWVGESKSGASGNTRDW